MFLAAASCIEQIYFLISNECSLQSRQVRAPQQFLSFMCVLIIRLTDKLLMFSTQRPKYIYIYFKWEFVLIILMQN